MKFGSTDSSEVAHSLLGIADLDSGDGFDMATEFLSWVCVYDLSLMHYFRIDAWVESTDNTFTQPCGSWNLVLRLNAHGKPLYT